MSLWNFSIFKADLRKLPLKFGQNLVSNSWGKADIGFVWVVGGGDGGVCVMQSHFSV